MLGFRIPILCTLLLVCAASLTFARQQASENPFALPQAKIHYAPDRHYDLLHVAFDLKLNYPQRTFRGMVTNTLTPLRNGLTTIIFHCGRNLQVQACEIAGHDAAFVHERETLKITDAQPLARGKPTRVTINYTC